MKYKNFKDEIDLFDIFIIIWKEKLKIITFTIVITILMFIYENNKIPPKSEAKTDIIPIRTYDENKYKLFNTYLYKTLNQIKIDDNNSIENKKEVQDIYLNLKSSKLDFFEINKSILFDLFFELLSQKSFLTQSIKKFNLIKKENFNNTEEYELAVSNYASSIKVKRSDGNNGTIIIKVFDLNNLQSFLNFLEKEANLKVQRDLKVTFDEYLVFAERLKRFDLEDIESQLSSSFNTTDDERVRLERYKKNLEMDQKFNRLKIIFENSPIFNSDIFYAAKINYDATEYEKYENSPIKMSVLAGFISLIFAILFVLISNEIKNRKK